MGRRGYHQPERRSADRQDASIDGFGDRQQRLSRVLSGLQRPRQSAVQRQRELGEPGHHENCDRAPRQPVHELYYNYSTWLDEDLTVKAGVPVAAAASPITALVFPGGNVNEV